MNRLPVTGSNQLLDLLDPYSPDDGINERWHLRPVRGPRWQFSAAPLWRVHLLALLTPVHSLNLLCTWLAEPRAGRAFARLRHRHDAPDVRILHAFRDRVGVRGLRQINEVLLQPLIPIAALWENATALIDAPDLPAACRGFKKRYRHLHRRPCGPRWAHAQDRPEPLVCRLQEAQLPPGVASTPARDLAGAAGQLGDARPCFQRRIVGAQPAVL